MDILVLILALMECLGNFFSSNLAYEEFSVLILALMECLGNNVSIFYILWISRSLDPCFDGMPWKLFSISQSMNRSLS